MTAQEPLASPSAGRLIYRLPELRAVLGGVSRNAIERMMAEEGLSPPIKLGPRSKGWIAEEVHAFIERRMAERDAKERPERPCA
jgi:predicted DNA-binding transcriptional regulator AlpA